MLIVDFDYHHGNGTEAVAGDGLSYVSTHAYPAYPGTGARSYRRGDDVVAQRAAAGRSGSPPKPSSRVWERAAAAGGAQRFAPILFVVSAGFDYVAGDRSATSASASRRRRRSRRRSAAPPSNTATDAVAYVLEGGYGLDALTRSIASIARDE